MFNRCVKIYGRSIGISGTCVLEAFMCIILRSLLRNVGIPDAGIKFLLKNRINPIYDRAILPERE